MSGATFDPYEFAQALVTSCIAGDNEAALAIFDDLVDWPDDGGDLDSTGARLSALALALTEIATTVHLAWASVLGLGRAEALVEWSRMVVAANLARIEREGTS